VSYLRWNHSKHKTWVKEKTVTVTTSPNTLS
jgi:hypothetical protein